MTKRGIIILFVVVAIIVGIGDWLTAEALAKDKRERLGEGLGRVGVKVKRYAFEHDGCYPESLEALLAERYLDRMPENPYTHEPMPILQPEDDPVPGGIVYLKYTLPASEGTEDEQDVDVYHLVVFADKPIRRFTRYPSNEYWHESVESIKWEWVVWIIGAHSDNTPCATSD